MKHTARPDSARHPRSAATAKARTSPPQAALSSGHCAQMASMMKGSSRAQDMAQLAEDARQSSAVQRLMGLSAGINKGAHEDSSVQMRAAAPVVQKLGSNVNLVGEDDRFFETRTGKTRLRVNPDADAYLEGHFDSDSASALTTASLGEKFSHAMNRVYKGIPYNRAGKIEAFDSNLQPVEGRDRPRRERSLGYMLHTESATCWEKAAHFHLVLAELGITTFLEGGASKADGEGHAWLVMPASEEAFGGKQVVIDPTSGEIASRTTYEKQYDITVPAKQVATPKVAASPREVEKALKEFADLERLGGIVKKAVLGTVDLKIERAMHEKRMEKENAEWEKLLLRFRQGIQ